MRSFIPIFLIGFAALIFACNSQPANPPQNTSTADAPHPGKPLYKQYCVTCHGADGKLGFSGAPDLTASVVGKEEAIVQVTKGKGLMTPFEGIMSEEEIENVVDYVITMRK